jgi:predicted enzyme related to lactoylglutathione lyase
MYISVVSLWVDDLERAIDFYTRTLGWQKTMDEPMGDGTRWVTVSPPGGQACFTLGTRERDETKTPGGNSGVVLEVDDVEIAHRDMVKGGVEFTMAPEQMPWGGWAMFKDSEGNVHGLHSPARERVSSN